MVKILSAPNFQPEVIRNQLFQKVVPPVMDAGHRLDNYEILQSIHSSPRSHLYLVQDVKNAKRYILKTPSKNFEEDEFYLQGFIREAWIGGKIDHPSISKIYPQENESKFLYHICEFVDGQNLRQWMYDNPKPDIDKVRQIIKQISEALRVLKRMEIIHRDLKPDNLMIDKDGQIKLIDYGTVSIASLDENINIIRENTPVGTLNYMAPETLIDLVADHQSDLFSLGVISYEMLTGELPYATKDNHKKVPKQFNKWLYRNARDYRNDIPLWLDIALNKAVSPDPVNRYQTYSNYIVDLTKPNLSSEKEYLNRPLIERNPLKFWKTLSVTLTILLAISLIR